MQVFVASDDGEAVMALQRLSELHVMYLPQDRSILDSHW
jgi:hypothetical protein